MKRTLLTTLLTLFAAAAFAQRGGVTATVVDADTGESVVGAVLTLTPVKTPEKKQYFTSAFKGAVSIPSLAYGEYSLSVAFLGYNNLDTTFRVSASKVSLGLLKLKPGVQIETVVKEAKALRTSQKGDTVSYNAGAFKVTADADVEGLLKKMPGITVTDGTVEAQGETVKKVFVAFFVFTVDQNVRKSGRAQSFHVVDREKVPLVLVAGRAWRFTQKAKLSGCDLFGDGIVQIVTGKTRSDRHVHSGAVSVFKIALSNCGGCRCSEDTSFADFLCQVVAGFRIRKSAVHKVGQFDIHDRQFGRRRRDCVIYDGTFAFVDRRRHAVQTAVHNVFEGHILIHSRSPRFQ